MRFLNWLKGGSREESEPTEAEISKTDEAELSIMDHGELVSLMSGEGKVISKPIAGKMSGFVDALIPVATAGADAAAQYGMAIVKFPEGVTWGDLCVRKSDGWNLLSSFKDGRFNDMAGIKQAALQPTAVANLAMQGAAVAVEAAYMAQISDQLKGIEGGIDAIKRELQLERDAKLLSSFEMLQRYSQRFEEYLASPEKKQAALIGIEQSLRDSKEIWRFQLDSMCDLQKEITLDRKPNKDKILRYSDRLQEMEKRSAGAFQLCAAVGQMSMRYDDDFSEKRIADERNDLLRLQEEYSNVRGAAYSALNKKALGVGGAPLALADTAEKAYKGTNPLANAAFEAGANLARVNPVRMRLKAKENTEEKRAELVDAITCDSKVRATADAQLETLDEINFMYNQAESMVLNGDEVLFMGPASDEASKGGLAISEDSAC